MTKLKHNIDLKLLINIIIAFGLWYFVFIIDYISSFWYRITISSITLVILTYVIGNNKQRLKKPGLVEALKGIFSGIALYALFFLGFNIFRPLVSEGAANVYLFRNELPIFIPSLLLLITSVCEELFWRGYIQNNLVQNYGVKGIFLSTTIYAMIHIFTQNYPLIFAAFIAGLAWAILYEYTDSIWIVSFSHIIWTELIFVFLPLK